MARTMWLAAAVLLAAIAPSPAADKAPAGTWKVLLPLNPPQRGGASPIWLLSFEEKDGAMTGKVLASHSEIGRSEMGAATVR